MSDGESVHDRLRTVTERWAALLALSCAIATLSCGSTSPTAPARLVALPVNPAPPPAVAATTAPSPVAVLALSSLAVKEDALSASDYAYYPRLELAETGGAAGATIVSLVVTTRLGTNMGMLIPGPCGGGNGVGRVSPASVWRLSRIPDYCLELDGSTDLRGQSVTITVNYVEDSGYTGQVSGTTIVG